MKTPAKYLVAACLLFSCSGDDQSSQDPFKDNNDSDNGGKSQSYSPPVFPEKRENVELPEVMDEELLKSSKALMELDLNQDISQLSVQELRLLRNSVYARYGYCFMKADIRGYFSASTGWYEKMMEDKYMREHMSDTSEPVVLTAEENKFVERVEKREKELLKNNFYDNKGYKLANVSNIVNLFQFEEVPPELMSMLDRQSFAIAPSDEIQLFHTYEKNDYHQVPNYVTTDLFLQLYHMYFSYLLKSLEMEKFSKLVVDISEGMNKEANAIASSAPEGQLRKAAEFNSVFFAIPYTIMTGKKLTVPASMAKTYVAELKNIQDESGKPALINTQDFPYGLFKPRGHYTRKEILKKYFRAMMWMQTAWNCRGESQDLANAALAAHILLNGKHKGKDLLSLYNSLYEPIVFIIGEPDNLSVNDIAEFLKSEKISAAGELISMKPLGRLNEHLQKLEKDRNRIRPKVELTCPDKINFMPQRYLIDNEILQEMVDLKPDAKRSMPRGLDIFAAFGVPHAEDILRNFHKDQETWSDFDRNLSGLQKRFSEYKDWDKTVYTKWIESLVVMQKKDPAYPGYMQTPYWDRKNLNTALASWAELKHDAILYGEQPVAAECGGFGPPPPVTVGYVEPNVAFWKKMIGLCKLTKNVLKENNLLSKDLESKNDQLEENATFLLAVSEKELKGQKLTEQEYNSIEIIGSSFEHLTLSILEPGLYLDHWGLVEGPDKSVSVVADIYTRNVPNCDHNGILHVGVGKVHEIYVVVEIEGYLYLTRGAVFGYHEFSEQNRLTDEDWQNKLETTDAPTLEEWMKELLVPSGKKPKVNEKLFYSSGC